jgi:hypothetical protein
VTEPLSPDLVEYLIIVVPDLDAVGGVASAVARLAALSTMSILDAIVVVRGSDDAVAVLEVEDIQGLEPLDAARRESGHWLSEHDVELSALALPPGSTGLVLVVVDRWAEPLSLAARAAGGSILGGERIPARRIESLMRVTDGATSAHNQATRSSDTEHLLTRPPASARIGDQSLAALVSDPIAQIHELADLCARGLLSSREFEEQKARVLRT